MLRKLPAILFALLCFSGAASADVRINLGLGLGDQYRCAPGAYAPGVYAPGVFNQCNPVYGRRYRNANFYRNRNRQIRRANRRYWRNRNANLRRYPVVRRGGQCGLGPARF